ncbi:MAG: HAMP domain-containing protein, partial [Desulfobulbaceae bacterium]|nr:HAMP domain-containing protein [Desulfobulbaceae bacterium]
MVLNIVKIRFSITFKLLLFILPLVFLPIAIVGYLSYHASVEQVSRLSRAEQMLQAKVAAAKINGIFESCRMDLETVSHLPAIEDYYSATTNGLKAEAKDSQEKIVKLFKDFVARSPYYCQIRFLDKDGRELVGVSALGRGGQHSSQQSKTSLQQDRYVNGEPLHISGISPSSSRQGFVVYFAKPFINIQKEFAGEVVIDLDYDKVIDLVKEVRVGEQGFAFMVDQLGRTIAHPQFRPYEYNLSKYPDPRLREFVIDMMAGETGWKRYYYLGEKAAAYAPIPVMNWSLAVSIPIEEFKREAEAIRTRVIQVVVATLFLVGLVVAVLSYNLLRPVRRLVAATEWIAGGDLSQEIPVKSRDELGTLTRSFNSMIVNLRDTQNELVRSEKLVALGRLSAGVAHEIRNPLNAMKGAIVHLKRRRSDDPLLQEYTEIILEEISRLNEFATEFLY